MYKKTIHSIHILRLNHIKREAFDKNSITLNIQNKILKILWEFLTSHDFSQINLVTKIYLPLYIFIDSAFKWWIGYNIASNVVFHLDVAKLKSYSLCCYQNTNNNRWQKKFLWYKLNSKDIFLTNPTTL